jgi:hypothetical protein
MNTWNITPFIITKSLLLAGLITFTYVSYAGNINPVIDDFSDPKNNSLGIPRQFLNDTMTGGGTTTEQAVSKGVISIKGKIIPPRGQPGWASTLLIIDPKGLPQDVSGFEGIRLLIKINKGNLNVSANSTDIKNYDYHAAPISVSSDGKFHEIKIPFTAMKRAWSEQITLNTKTINSVTIVAYDLQKGCFDFEVDEVSFY